VTRWGQAARSSETPDYCDADVGSRRHRPASHPTRPAGAPCHRPWTRTGESLSAVEPSPSCPDTLPPQHSGFSLLSRAHVVTPHMHVEGDPVGGEPRHDGRDALDMGLGRLPCDTQAGYSVVIFEGPGDLAAVAQYRSLELFYDRYEVIALSAAGVFSALSIFLSDLPRAFRTADLWLVHAADCRSRYSLRTCCGTRY